MSETYSTEVMRQMSPGSGNSSDGNYIAVDPLPQTFVTSEDLPGLHWGVAIGKVELTNQLKPKEESICSLSKTKQKMDKVLSDIKTVLKCNASHQEIDTLNDLCESQTEVLRLIESHRDQIHGKIHSQNCIRHIYELHYFIDSIVSLDPISEHLGNYAGHLAHRCWYVKTMKPGSPLNHEEETLKLHIQQLKDLKVKLESNEGLANTN